jgi:Ca2+-binding RTX toxin-like protein
MAVNFHNVTPFWRDTVRGSVEADEIFTYWDNDTIYGYEGNDLLNAGQGNDTVFGGDGNDTILGEVGEDLLYGEDGNDHIDGGAFKDQIYGGAGNDVLIGGHGEDRMFGGSGNDTFLQTSTESDHAADLVDGGTGIDTVDYRKIEPGSGRSTPAVTVQLADGTDDGTAVVTYTLQNVTPFIGGVETFVHTDTLRSIENVTTGGENDSLVGNVVANVLDAGGGNDVLTGGGGADRLIGGSGNDTFVYRAITDSPVSTFMFNRFVDRAGNETFYGGTDLNFGFGDRAGNETFYGGTDLIVGFGDRAGNNDVFDLRAIDANSLLGGDQSFSLENNDGVTSIGELRHFTRLDQAQDRVVSYLAADTNGDGLFDFGLRFDRVVANFSTPDFLF